ncbi:MAG: fluoride efflux transporter FluC, partial [Desulfocucumaceae bacterium]
MKNFISVGLGGSIGALARYFIYVPLNTYSPFPWGTLTVNLFGSFFLAFFLTIALRHLYHRATLVLAVSTGFTGAFTTFSAVSVEIVKLSSTYPTLSLIYIGVSFTAGLFLAL